MFIAHSAARVRLVRTIFVLAGLIPCAAIVAWAVHLRSESHRESVRLAWQRTVGLPLAIGTLESVRPGVVRARDCTLTAAEGAATISCAAVEVEVSATEVRLRIERLRCDPAAARLLGFVAREWLERGARFDRDCVVEVADFAWSLPGVAVGESPRGSRESAAAAVRIECVSQPGAQSGPQSATETRAIRVVRRSGIPGGRDDELRVVRTADAETAAAGERIDIEAAWAEPLPFDVLAAIAADTPIAGWFLGRAAAATGTVRASRAQGRWTAELAGRIADVDLAAGLGMLATRGSGSAVVDLVRCSCRDDRLIGLEVEATAGAGLVERRFLDSLLGTLGCRPGPAYPPVSTAGDVAFDVAAWRLTITGRGVEIASGPRLTGPLALAGGHSLLEPPPVPTPVDRLAWLLAPPAAVPVPAGGPAGWLMSVMPRPGDPPERTSQAERHGPGRGF